MPKITNFFFIFLYCYVNSKNIINFFLSEFDLVVFGCNSCTKDCVLRKFCGILLFG